MPKTTATTSAIERAALARRTLHHEIQYARRQDPTRGDVQPRGELVQAFGRATAELDRLCDEAIEDEK